MKTTHVLAGVAILAALFGNAVAATAPNKPVSAPVGVMEALKANTPQDVIVEFDSTAIQAEADTQRKTLKLERESRGIVEYKAKRYSDIKSSSFAKLPKTEHEILHDYDHLPMMHLRIKSANALNALLRDPAIKAIYKDEIKYATLDAASLNLVKQPSMPTNGLTGYGSVVVIDSGVDYTKADFGCTAPGVPADCKVSYYQNLVGTGTLDNIGHGSNVSGIIAAIAPTAKIVSLNVFGANASTSDSLVIAALNNIISNYYSYAGVPVAAVNMSLGDNGPHGSCSGTAYDTPISQLAQHGIPVFVATGNNAYGYGINSPSCVPNVTPVGAVYSANIGAMTYGSLCADATTAANQVACFTNFDSSFPNMVLAPGVNQTAGGYTMTGTSMATPYVSATATIRAQLGLGISSGAKFYTNPSYITYPSWGPSVNVTRRENSITVNSGTFQSLDMQTPLISQNDNFATPGVLNGVSSSWYWSTNALATKEVGEPNHAGNSGGRSTWTTFTSIYNTDVTVDTHGSRFDTLLAVYTGTSVSTLTQIAANDDDGSYTVPLQGTSGLTFPAQAGVTYNIAVDGKNGARGTYYLNVKYLPSSNSTFLTRTPITGASGSVTGVSVGNYLWWSWIAPANGQVTIGGQGAFNVYTGTTESSLTALTGVNGKYIVQSGVQYQIRVDSSGNVVLNWNLNTSPTADLSLTLNGTVNGSTATGLNYWPQVINAGPDIAVNSKLSLTLPAKVTFSNASPGCTALGAIVTCLLGNMSPGTNTNFLNIYISGTVSTPGTYVTSASVTSDVTDPVSSNNSASMSSTIVASSADLSITSFVGSGDQAGNLNYSIGAKNNGPDIVQNAKLTITLPAFATFSSGSGCTASGVTVTCLLGSMGNGATQVISLIASAPSIGTYVANASVSSEMMDPNTANNSASVSVTITEINNDVPTLPEWGIILMSIVLMASSVIAEKKRRGKS